LTNKRNSRYPLPTLARFYEASKRRGIHWFPLYTHRIKKSIFIFFIFLANLCALFSTTISSLFSTRYKIGVDKVFLYLYSGEMKQEHEIMYTKEYQKLAKEKQDKLRIVRKAERFANKVEQMLTKKAPTRSGT
jgi:hypothetical protein